MLNGNTEACVPSVTAIETCAVTLLPLTGRYCSVIVVLVFGSRTIGNGAADKTPIADVPTKLTPVTIAVNDPVYVIFSVATAGCPTAPELIVTVPFAATS